MDLQSPISYMDADCDTYSSSILPDGHGMPAASQLGHHHAVVRGRAVDSKTALTYHAWMLITTVILIIHVAAPDGHGLPAASQLGHLEADEGGELCRLQHCRGPAPLLEHQAVTTSAAAAIGAHDAVDRGPDWMTDRVVRSKRP